MITGQVAAFSPTPASSIGLALSGTVASSGTFASGGDAVLFTNATNVLVFVRIGAGAKNTDTPLPAGDRILLASAPDQKVVSAVASATPTGTVYATPGAGTNY